MDVTGSIDSCIRSAEVSPLNTYRTGVVYLFNYDESIPNIRGFHRSLAAVTAKLPWMSEFYTLLFAGIFLPIFLLAHKYVSVQTCDSPADRGLKRLPTVVDKGTVTFTFITFVLSKLLARLNSEIKAGSPNQ